MTLDIFALAGDLRAWSEQVQRDLHLLAERLGRARGLLAAEAADWDFWHDAVAEATRGPGLLARPLEAFDRVADVPACPPEYVVAASDGSHYEIEYGGLHSAYVINIGTAVIHYGPAGSFEGLSRPMLGYLPHELTIRDDASGKEFPITGNLLAAERDLREGLALRNVAQSLPPELPRLALQDGTLIRWTLQSLDDVLKRRLLADYLGYLAEMAVLPCPVVSYLSRPRSIEVTSFVKFLHVRGDWPRWQKLYPFRADDPFNGVADYLIYRDLLADGQRSAVWLSQSQFNVDLYAEQPILFCYLKVGGEVARIEFPRWVWDTGQLDLVHSLVYDQARRGLGYPAVIQRAHEQAVIHDDDRQHLEQIIERLLAQGAGLPASSAKTATKLHPRV